MVCAPVCAGQAPAVMPARMAMSLENNQVRMFVDLLQINSNANVYLPWHTISSEQSVSNYMDTKFYFGIDISEDNESV